MKSIRVLMGIVLATALCASLCLAQSGYDLFQKALVKERAEGDLKAAIQIYEQIVKQYPNDRELAAKSLVEMGKCYEELGKSEARQDYERVLRDYADQNESVTEARARLAALLGNSGAKSSELVTRRIWAGPDVDTLGAVSPDGRFLSFVDWSTGDLAVRDLGNGESRHLTDHGGWSSSSEFALFSSFSPDGKQVAYTWFNKDFQSDVRVVGLDGSGSRVLYTNKEAEADPLDWSADGKYILARSTSQDRTNKIILVSAADGSVQVLKTFDWRFPEKMCFSPDGRYIAYDFPPEQNSPNRDIYLLASDGSREIPLVQDPADDRLLGWAPDGKKVFFASDRTGSMSLWSLEVANGKPRGEPELVRADVGNIAALGITRKGAFYYGVQIGRQDVYVATLDETTGKQLRDPTPITHRYVGSNSSPHWSRDGQYLAYTSQRGRSNAEVGSTVIVIRSMKTGDERELTTKMSYFHLGPWSPDGRALLLWGSDTKGRQGIYSVDSQNGAVSPLVIGEPGIVPFFAEWSPDGKAIVFRRDNNAAKAESLVSRELDTGRETELYRVPSPPGFLKSLAISPDGREVAILWVQSKNQPELLMVIPASGGEPRKILEVRDPELIATVGWTPDSQHLVFPKGRYASQDPKTELWQIRAEGGVPEKLGLAMDIVTFIRINPDGRRVAIAAGLSRSEVWVMENFLPPLRAAK